MHNLVVVLYKVEIVSKLKNIPKMVSLSKLQVLAAFSVVATANGFVVQPKSPLSALRASTMTDLPEAMYDTPSECYIIYPDEEAQDQEPKFVCTNAPEEYAWFNGINTKDMIPAKERTSSFNAMECQETESYRGIPEWEFSLGMTSLRP